VSVPLYRATEHHDNETQVSTIHSISKQTRTISSGLRIPNCTRPTSRNGADESDTSAILCETAKLRSRNCFYTHRTVCSHFGRWSFRSSVISVFKKPTWPSLTEDRTEWL